MRPRIAIPIPHSVDAEYSARALPQYERAVEQAGGEPVRIPLDRATAEVQKLAQHCDAVLLPGICYGLQSLNVYRSGSLVQHIESTIDHEAGRKVAVAHDVVVDAGSRLAEILTQANADPTRLAVNSSHHQSAHAVGKGLRIVARCPQDGIVEALEGTDPDHFVLAVQWHPERSIDDDDPSRAIFRALVEATNKKE